MVNKEDLIDDRVKVISARLPIKLHGEFKSKCNKKGLYLNKVLISLIKEYLK